MSKVPSTINEEELSPLLKKVKERKIPYTMEEIQQVKDKIVNARSDFLMRQPFFGIMSMNLVLVDASNWLVTAATDGKRFYYNVGFFNLLEPEEIKFVFAHEILHCAYDHFSRTYSTDSLSKYIEGDLTFDEKQELNRKLVNIAADYCVNRDLVECEIGQMIRPEIIKLFYDKKYDGKIMEEVYKDLLKNGAGKGSVLDDHSVGQNAGSGAGNQVRKAKLGDEEGEGEGPSSMSDEERENAEREFKEKMITAYDAQEAYAERKQMDGQSAGKMPAELKRIIDRLRKPEINWRTYIRKKIISYFKLNEYWASPHRRTFDSTFILPGCKQAEKVDIHIAVDCSGSISEVELGDFLTEIYGITNQFKDYTIRVWTFDAKVYKESYQEYTPRNIKELPKYKFFGGGGTSFQVNWDFMKEKRIKPHVFIMFTDGYTGDTFGDAGYCETVFVINTDVVVPPEFGKTIRYKPKRT
jgi:predicted metal-dependent peptidase